MWIYFVHNLLSKMGFIKDVLLNFNSFQTQQFFRFNGDYEYTNVLGGVFTLLIRALLLAMLIYKLLAVFRYATVNTTTTIKYEINQVNSTLSPKLADSPFLIAIEVVQQTTSLNQSTFINNTVAWAVNSTYHYTLLQPCTPQHWQAGPPGSYKELTSSVAQGSLLFCLPLTFAHQISIAQDSTIEIDFALRCRANCSDIDLVKLLVRPIILNWLINSQQSEDYLTWFLQKRRYYGIDTQNYAFDTALSYELAKFHISTDSSLLPYEQIREDSGILIPTQPGLSYYPNRFTNFVFVRMTFQLSNQQFEHKRSFTKIFDAISQIGGLIPIFMILFLWLNYYAMSHFEMTFIKRLHSDQKAKQYGVFYFLSKFFYSILKLFHIDVDKWQKTQQFHKMHKVVNHLIDIIYLYKRIEFLERALEVILEEHQIKALHLMRNKTFAEAEKQYENYQMKNNLEKFIKKRKSANGTKNPGAFQEGKREIFLEPNPTQSDNQFQPANTDKGLVKQPDFEAQLNQKGIWAPKLYPIKMDNEEKAIPNEKTSNDQMDDEQEEDSEYNQEVELHQMNELRQAFACYQRLRREAHDSGSQYYNCISKNILKKLDDTDRELLNNLQNLLESSQKEQIMALVYRSLLNSQHFSIQQSLYRKNSRKSNNDMESKEGMIYSKERQKSLGGSLDSRRKKMSGARRWANQDPKQKRDGSQD